MSPGLRQVLRGAGCLSAALILLFCAVGSGAGFAVELPFRLLFGWISFLRRTLPQITWNLEAIAGFALTLVLLVAAAHALARRARAARAPEAPPWPLKWTCIGVAGLVCMFGTSVASAGLAHQTLWLLSDEAPMVENSWERGWIQELGDPDRACAPVAGFTDLPTLQRGVYTDPDLLALARWHQLLPFADPTGAPALAIVAGPASPRVRAVICRQRYGRLVGEEHLAPITLEMDPEVPDSVVLAAGGDLGGR